MNNLLGVILCGGESRRMGSDKGLMKIDSKTWAEHVSGKITAAGLPVVVSINEPQRDSYGNIFSGEQLIVDNIDVSGPLKGLLSAHYIHPSSDILLMACDLIDMDEQTISQLVHEYRSRAGYDFYVYHDTYSEPFCAIYTASALAPVLEKAQQHSLTRFSFQNILDEGKTLRIPIKEKTGFRNYNTIPGHHQ